MSRQDKKATTVQVRYHCVRCGKELDPARDPAVTTLGPRCAAHF